MDLVWFAGGGGSSEGARAALGKSVDYALNHNPVALAMHEANSPETMHLCADVWDVAPAELEPGRRIRSMWFSPDCTHFSKARGSAPVSERIRGLAFCIVPWARERKPDVILVENVEEFRDAGPLLQPPHARAGYPDPERKGEHFRLLNDQLAAEGYKGEWRELVAADFGAPTTRKRLYGVFRRDGLPIVWPERTHAPRKDARRLGLKPWRGFCEVADWSRPCPSIFLTPEEAKAVGVKRPLAPATERRIAKGIDRFVISGTPFIVPITHTGERRSPPVSDPLNTITSAHRGELAVCAPTIARPPPRAGEGDPKGGGGMTHRSRTPPQSLRDSSPVADGGARDEIRAATVVRTDMAGAQKSGVFAADEPVRTMTGAGGFAEVESSLSPFVFGCGGRRGQSPERSTEQPMATVTAKADSWLGVAFLDRAYTHSAPQSAEDPVRAVMGEPHDWLTVAHMTMFNENSIGRDPSEPLHTVMAGAPRHGVVAATLDPYYRTGVGSDAAEPAPTLTGRDRLALTAAFLEQANTGMVGHPADAPLSTIVGRGTTQRLIEARLQAIGAPEGTRRRQVLEFLWRHFGAPEEADWSDPTGSLQARRRFGLVILKGPNGRQDVWEIADIGMRMLTVRELFSAQGFPPDYVIDRDHAGRPITKTAATLMVGNSVSPVMARVLYAAQFPNERRREAA